MRLTGLDTAFLCLDRDVTPMHLGALAIFRPVHVADPGGVAVLLAERAQRLRHLRRRVEPPRLPLSTPTWAEDPGFCAKDHIEVHHIGRHGGLDEVATLAAELMIRPLERRRPLWELHVIAGADWNRFAVLFKMHHAFGDGLNALEIGVRVLDEFTPGSAGSRRSGEVDDETSCASEPSVLARLWRASGDGREVVECVIGHLSDVTDIAVSVLRNARLTAVGSPLVISSSGRRDLAVAVLDLVQVRRIRAHHRGTVNDVLLSVLTGALREWLVARGHRVDGLTLRAFIPVSQRARSGECSGGNRLSGYLCGLPVGEPDASKRLLMIRVATPMAGQCAPLLFDLMVTSIPVPSLPFTLDGAGLEEVFPIAPLAAGQALVIGLSWYRSHAYVVLHNDREGLPDVHKLAAAIQPAASALEESH